VQTQQERKPVAESAQENKINTKNRGAKIRIDLNFMCCSVRLFSKNVLNISLDVSISFYG
jgi:hypothetical protein